MKSRLALDIQPQPDDATCGPTCLHAVYRYFGDPISLEQIISEIVPLETGGTLAVHLGSHALRRGYAARIYTYNLHLFDPTWFRDGVDIAARMRLQAAVKSSRKLRAATSVYLEFLELGGELRFEDLSTDLLTRHLTREAPVLTGLSATYLYGCAREVGRDSLHEDDIRGSPTGHFVVLCGYDPETRLVLVADPLGDNDPFGSHSYQVGVERVLGAILLGVITYDANLLILAPGKRVEE